MAKRPNTGGQAYPRAGFSGPRGYGRPEDGMTLRDYFAAQALTGMIQGYATAYGSPTSAPSEIASEAWMMADEMLAARDKSDA